MMFPRNSRPMSAGEIKELYGTSVRQLRSSETVFRKDAFKRDKLRLSMVVQAIDNEMKHVERKWDTTKSRFVRQHAEFVYPQKGKVTYRKVGTVSSQPVESIPPCIPFVGAFPPYRHPTKERRVSEMFKEPLFRHGALHEATAAGDTPAVQEGEERNQSQNDYSYFLANRRVSNSFGSASLKPTRGSSTRGSGTLLTSPRQARYQTTGNNRSRFNVDGFPGVKSTGSQQFKRSGRTTSAVKTEEQAAWKSTPSSVKGKNNATQHYLTNRMHQDESQQSHVDRSVEGNNQGSQVAPSGGESPCKSDFTSDSLDVELLQQALTDHSSQTLVRNRWQRAVESVIFLSANVHGYLDLQYSRNLLGSTPSLGSISTPTTRTATDISENDHDVAMMVIQIILQVFKELDQMELDSLTDLWPGKMENLMTTMEDLIRNTGVEVTEIVEKIQRGDIQDEKSAALLDWVRNIDNNDIEQETARRLSIQSDGQKLNSTIESKVVTDTITCSILPLVEQQKESNIKRKPSQEISMTKGSRKIPTVNILPPSRRQSHGVEAENDTEPHETGVIQSEVGPHTNSDAMVPHKQTERSGHHKPEMRPVSSVQKQSESTRRLSFADTQRVKSASGPSSGEASRKQSQDGLLDLTQRPRAATYSKFRSTESDESLPHITRPRINSTGQQYSRRKASQDTLFVRRNSRQGARGETLSPSAVNQRKESLQGSDQLEPHQKNIKTAFGDASAQEERLETTETSLYTDRRGMTHRLTMRKASLNSVTLREANVTVTREDTLPGERLRQKTAEEIKEHASKMCDEAPTSTSDGVASISPSSAQEVGHASKTLHGTTRATHDDVSPDSLPNETSREENRQTPVSPRQGVSPDPQPEEGQERPDKDELLWKKRLSQPTIWAPELSTDLKGQGLALYLLYRKEGNGPKFRSTALKVICINVLRAAKNIHDDVAFRELKKCRYLRMPPMYFSDVQRELNLSEIFA